MQYGTFWGLYYSKVKPILTGHGRKVPFSNSPIIHDEKTKEITVVKEVWICDPHDHQIRGTFALNFSKKY